MFIAGKLKYKKLQNDARPENLIQPSTRIEPPSPTPGTSWALLSNELEATRCLERGTGSNPVETWIFPGLFSAIA